MTTVSTSVDHQSTAAQRNRWLVHLSLIVTFLASLAIVAFRFGIGSHEIVGLVFAALILIHLAQRRNRIRSLVAGLASVATWRRRAGRLAWSDLILTFIFVNLIVSGIADYYKGAPGIFINIGLIRPIRWHAISAIALFVYLVVHIVRRAKRLRRSRVN